MRLRIFGALALALLASFAPAVASRVTIYGQEQPSSAQVQQGTRFQRIDDGTLRSILLGPTLAAAGTYGGLSVVPVTGLTVAVSPTTSGGSGAVFQLLADDPSAWGGGPYNSAVALSADSTKLTIQGDVVSATASITVTAPATAGQSQDALIECAVTVTDATSSPSTFVTDLQGDTTTASVNQYRLDLVACQAKEGTAAATGSQTVPTVDSGYVAIGYVAVPQGTSTVTTGMITALPSLAMVQSVAAGSNIVVGGTANAPTIATTASPTFSSASLSNTSGGILETLTGGTTTSPVYEQFTNSGATTYFGVEGSASGGILAGDTAYATVLTSSGSTPLQIGTNNTPRITITGAAGNMSFNGTATFLSTLQAAGITSTVGVAGTSVTDSGLTSGNCVQVSTGGLLSTIAYPCAGGVAANTANVATSSTSEVQIIGTTVPANMMVVGTTYHVHCFGQATVSAAGTVTFRLRIGSATLTGTVIQSLADTTVTGSGINFLLDGWVTVRSTGTSGTALGRIYQTNSGTTGLSVNANLFAPGNGTAPTAATVNTAQANVVEFTMQTSATTSTPTVDSAVLTVEKT